MTIFKKVSLYAFIVPFLIVSLINSMEYPHGKISCSLMIDHKAESPVEYATKRTHAQNNLNLNLASNIKDPLTHCILTSASNDIQIRAALPAKMLPNLSTGSQLQMLYYLPFSSKPLLIDATCHANPNLHGKTFYKQNKNIMISFYDFPSIHVEKNPLPFEEASQGIKIEKDSLKELKASGIIQKQQASFYASTRNDENRETFSGIIEGTIYTHGSYGCSDEQSLVQSIIDTKIPAHKNKFTYLRNRETSGRY